jgi:hypothetical protein
MIRYQRIPSRKPMEEKRPLRRQPESHHFWSLIMLALMAAAFLLVVWVAIKSLFIFLQESPFPWNRLAKARSCLQRIYRARNDVRHRIRADCQPGRRLHHRDSQLSAHLMREPSAAGPISDRGRSFIGGGASHDATPEEACRVFGSQSALGAFHEAHQGIGDGMMCTVLWRRMPERHRSE